MVGDLPVASRERWRLRSTDLYHKTTDNSYFERRILCGSILSKNSIYVVGRKNVFTAKDAKDTKKDLVNRAFSEFSFAYLASFVVKK